MASKAPSEHSISSSREEKTHLIPDWIGDTALNKQGQPTVREFKKQKDRDPHKINQDVQIDFADIIAEPDSFRSSSYVWTMSQCIFKDGKNAAYQFLSFVVGVPLSCFWGLFFALTAYMHVWCYAPLKRSQTIKMGCWAHFLSKFLSVVFDPFFESVGKTFSEVKIHHNVVDGSTEKITVK